MLGAAAFLGDEKVRHVVELNTTKGNGHVELDAMRTDVGPIFWIELGAVVVNVEEGDDEAALALVTYMALCDGLLQHPRPVRAYSRRLSQVHRRPHDGCGPSARTGPDEWRGLRLSKQAEKRIEGSVLDTKRVRHAVQAAGEGGGSPRLLSPPPQATWSWCRALSRLLDGLTRSIENLDYDITMPTSNWFLTHKRFEHYDPEPD